MVGGSVMLRRSVYCFVCLAYCAEGKRCEGVATIDVSAYVDEGSSAESKLRVREEFDAAMREFGMACIVNHGVEANVIEEAEAAAKRFFELGDEMKRRHGDPELYGPEGYTPRGVEAVARSMNDTESKADAVENFVFIERPPLHPREAPERPLTGLEDWCPKARVYWDEMTRVLHVLLRISADIFKVPHDFFPAHYTGEDCGNALRFARYPEHEIEDGVLRYGTHTDYLTFTILHAQGPGLQVEDIANNFTHVLPTQEALVVNAGDLNELWSNGIWRSAVHRVLPVSLPNNPRVSAERFASVFFSGPSHSKLITPIVAPGDIPRYDPVNAGEYLRSKLDPTTVITESASSNEDSSAETCVL